MLRRFFKKILRRNGFRITNYESVNFNRACLDRFEIMLELYSEVRLVPGCIVEMGYGYGISFSTLAYLSQNEGRRIYSYDSFKGFPDPSFQDISIRTPKKGDWSHRTKQEAIVQLMDFGIEDLSRFYFIEGFVEESLQKLAPEEEICFLHVDLDLYSGYKISLEKLWPLVASGGIVLFDEYNDLKWPGATKAINEFIQLNSLEIRRHTSGKYYVKKF